MSLTISSEKLLLRFADGPYPQDYILDTLDWPLPEKILCKGFPGYYVKVFESQTDEAPEGSLRGAIYMYKEA